MTDRHPTPKNKGGRKEGPRAQTKTTTRRRGGRETEGPRAEPPQNRDETSVLSAVSWETRDACGRITKVSKGGRKERKKLPRTTFAHQCITTRRTWHCIHRTPRGGEFDVKHTHHITWPPVCIALLYVTEPFSLTVMRTVTNYLLALSFIFRMMQPRHSSMEHLV